MPRRGVAPPASNLALDSRARLGPYEILGPAGSGGMGEVYRARDTRLDRLVAIKVLPDAASSQALERFEREAKTIAALSHPGICAIYDVGTTPVPFLVMELLDGETLYQRLQRGPLDVPTLVDNGIALADALAAAHAKGITHRDLKPANIFLTTHGPKILDFGLARITGSAPAVAIGATTHLPRAREAPLTDAGVAVGTVAYMSPEQLRGESLDTRTDLFSLGLVLYEMATGRQAFAGATTAVISAAILHEQPTAPRQVRPGLPARLDQAIVTLIEKDRDLRTQSAVELRAELARLKRELAGTRAADAPAPDSMAGNSLPPSTTATAATPISSDTHLVAELIRRHRGAAAIVAASLLATVGGIIYVVESRGAAPAKSGSRELSIVNLQVEQLTTSGTAGAPAISPDGNYVVYVESGSGTDALRVRQVATASNVEIVAPEVGTTLRGGTITPPDGAYVNYVKQVGGQPRELWQIPFLGGAARRILEGGRVGFSPHGDRMAFVRPGSGNRTELVVAASDGGNQRVLASREPPELFSPVGARTAFAPAWSPDGSTIAVIGARLGESSTGQLVFVDAASGSQRAVNAGPSVGMSGVAWLNGGTLLVTMANKPSAPTQLWVMSYPDGTLKRLTNDTSQYFGVSVTGDGDRLVTARQNYSFVIWTSDATARQWSQAVPARPAKGPVSSGVRWLGDDLLYVSSANDWLALARWRTSTHSEEVLAQGAGRPSVANDASTILYFDYDTREVVMVDPVTRKRTPVRHAEVQELAHLTADDLHYVMIEMRAGQPPALVLASLDGTNSSRTITTDRVRASTSALEGSHVEVSPDGRWVGYPSVSAHNQFVVAVCDVAACSSRREFPNVGSRWRWTRDSRALAYADTKTLSDLWLQPLDGAPSQLTHFAPDGNEIWDFDWSADGRRLAVSRGKTSADIVLFRGLNGKN